MRGPYGTHWPLAAGRWPLAEAEAEGGDMVVVAGGVGLLPLRPALYHLLAHRDLRGTLPRPEGGPVMSPVSGPASGAIGPTIQRYLTGDLSSG